jgi:hypothetical protein
MVIYKVTAVSGRASFVTAARYEFDPERGITTFYEDAEGNYPKAFYTSVESVESYGKAPYGSEALPVVWVANPPKAEVLQQTEELPGAGLSAATEVAGNGTDGSGEGS